jgi:hypothetical protein
MVAPRLRGRRSGGGVGVAPAGRRRELREPEPCHSSLARRHTGRRPLGGAGAPDDPTQALGPAPTARQGAKAFSTPRSAGARAGRCRSSTLDMSLSAIHSSPTWV